MTPFAIFAFVLTFGYVIYFAVMITLDLHAKPVDGQKAEGEDIDVEGMTDEGDETPKVITEDPDSEGARMTYTDSVDEDGVRVVNPTGTSATIPSENEEPVVDPDPVPEEKEKTTSEELNEDNEYGMEDIDPEPQYSMYGDDLYAFINEKHNNSRNIKKENVRDHL